jgi:hypothetical protein
LDARDWGVFFTDSSLFKSSYNSVKMVVYFGIINLVRNYVVINELKSPYENKPL